MEAKLTKTDKSPIPAGMFGEGIEAFWYEGEKWVIANGTISRYNEAPTHAKATIQRAFMNDRQSLAYMAKMGLRNANEIFDTWYCCVVGGIDHVADFTEKTFTPDVYNNLCSDAQCPHRGRLCGRASALRNYEVETIRSLMAGKSMEQASESLFVSLPAVKSRVAKLHEKLGVNNTAAMVTRAAEIGIF